MAKIALSLLALVLLISSAAALEILNPTGARGRCRQQIERQRLSSCRQYLRDGSRFDSVRREDGRGWREAFPECCEELEQINRQCRCEAVKQVVREERETGRGLQGREMREMLKTAQSLPSLCRISPQYCEAIAPMF